MTRAILCTASMLQALTGVVLLRLGPGAGLLAVIVILTGLIGLLSQHPAYMARLSIKVTAIVLNVPIALVGVLFIVPSTIVLLWAGSGQAMATVAVTAIAGGAGGVNIICLVVLLCGPAPVAGRDPA